MIRTDYHKDNKDGNEDINMNKWILGLSFWKKYQFFFDIDNKLIYFYNKEGKYMIKPIHRIQKNEMHNINKEIENNNTDTNITNNKKISSPTNNINKEDNNSVKVDKNIFIILLIGLLILLFCFLLFLIRKEFFKKGYILMKNKQANELEDENSYSSKSINFIKEQNNLNKKEFEMQVKLNE